MPINSDSGNPKGFSAHALDLAARSRTVFIALLLLQTMGGMTWTLTAQAAPGRYVFYLTPSGDRDLDRVCAGDSVVFNVIAERRLADNRASALAGGGGHTNPPQQVAGVTINGSVLNAGYGTLKPASSKTSVRSKPPGSAAFTFFALRPGSTKLRFTGLLPAALLKSPGRTYVPLTRDVRIVSCNSPIQAAVSPLAPGAVPIVSTVSKDRKVEVSKVRVTTISTWSAGMDIVARIDDGVMEADDQGHFTGSANVTWQTSVIGSAGCGAAENSVAPSRADLTGEIDESNQLVVKITFQPRDFSGFATCGGQTISTVNLATPDPLTISVAATGGTSTQTHAVTAKNGSFVGSATIVVTTERK